MESAPTFPMKLSDWIRDRYPQIPAAAHKKLLTGAQVHFVQNKIEPLLGNHEPVMVVGEIVEGPYSPRPIYSVKIAHDDGESDIVEFASWLPEERSYNTAWFVASNIELPMLACASLLLPPSVIPPAFSRTPEREFCYKVDGDHGIFAVLFNVIG